MPFDTSATAPIGATHTPSAIPEDWRARALATKPVAEDLQNGRLAWSQARRDYGAAPLVPGEGAAVSEPLALRLRLSARDEGLALCIENEGHGAIEKGKLPSFDCFWNLSALEDTRVLRAPHDERYEIYQNQTVARCPAPRAKRKTSRDA